VTEKCQTCQRDPKRMNSELSECSHPDCPSRKPVTAYAPDYTPQWRLKTSDGDTQ